MRIALPTLFAWGCQGPTVVLTAPTPDAQLSGAIALKVDTRRVQTVAYSVDDTPVARSEQPPFDASWDPTGALNGNHVVEVVARDRYDRPVSDTVEFWLDDPAGLPPSAVAITWPTASQPVCGDVPISVRTSPDVALVALSANGSPLDEPVLSAWEAGEVALVALATAADGRQAMHKVSLTVDPAPCDDIALRWVSPSDGAAVQGVIDSQAEARALSVRFTVDGVPWVDDTTSPYVQPYDTSFLSEGEHRFEAWAQGTGGLARDGATLLIDRTAPLLDVSSPASGQTVGVDLTVRGQADDVRLDHVRLDVDGVEADRATTSPFQLHATLTGEEDLQVVAVDAAGNQSIQALTVQVDQPPQVSFLWPLDGDAVVLGDPLQLDLHDDSRIEQVDLYVDGSLTGSSNLDPFPLSVDSCLALGAHELRVVATDSRGQQGEATVSIQSGEEDGDGDGALGCADCDDDDPRVNPDAVEVCGNGVDDDCDGLVGRCGLEGTLSAADANVRLLGESVGGETGKAIALGDADGDGTADLLIGAPSTQATGHQAGSAYLVRGPFSVSSDLGDANLRVYGAEGDELGAGVLMADLDLDGADELVVGGFGGNGTYGDGYGSVWVFADAAEAGLVVAADAADATWADATFSGALGRSMIALRADSGPPRVAIGQYAASRSRVVHRGVVYLVDDPLSGGELEAAETSILGEESEQYFGIALDSGDFDADGADELAVGATGDSTTGAGGGAVYLFGADVRGVVSSADADVGLYADSGGDYAGYSLASGDVDGDGHRDLLVGGVWDGDGAASAGAAWLVLGPFESDRGLIDADAKLLGEAYLDYAGYSLAVGDVDGDGAPELAVGALYADGGGEYGGTVYLLPGSSRGVLSLGASPTLIEGEEADGVGAAVRLHDLDGDGFDDLVLGATVDGDVGVWQGSVLLFYGGVGG